MTTEVTLYIGPHCPLCDQAKALLYPVLSEFDAILREVDISSSETLRNTYGTRIPVIKMADGVEKGWPFTTGQVRKLLASRC